MLRVGIIALLHESNTFIQSPTTLDHFRNDVYLFGDEIPQAFRSGHHEIGGMLQRLEESRYSLSEKSGLETVSPQNVDIEVVPIVAFRATPSGPITEETWEHLLAELLERLRGSMPLDGLLIAAHGAAVAEHIPDADGDLLTRIREAVGLRIPVVATLDPHANLSEKMVRACTALTAYRTNPHLDQHARGVEAASILVRAMRNEIRPTMAARLLPLVINIERQSTDEPHLKRIYEIADKQLANPAVISNSILLGFPYADVPEMGSAVLVITDNDADLAESLVEELAQSLWKQREAMQGVLVDIPSALDQIQVDPSKRYCILDMGDNVGGGSAADGTLVAKSLADRKIGPSFVCIYDPQGVVACQAKGVGQSIELAVGGKTDRQHGDPWKSQFTIEGFYDGLFTEDRPRHGGIREFDQGATVVLRATDAPITLLLTSKRMVPFSLNQLISCGLSPESFRVLVAKGVHAPLAAYREVCDAFLRVNTPGSTCADLFELEYRHRRHPLYPFEKDF